MPRAVHMLKKSHTLSSVWSAGSAWAGSELDSGAWPLIQAKHLQTLAHGLNLTYKLYVYGPQAKNYFHVYKG